MKRLVLTEIARADLASIRRYSARTWGRNQTTKYMDALRDAMKGLVRGTVLTRRVPYPRRPVLHQSMDYRRHLSAAGEAGNETN